MTLYEIATSNKSMKSLTLFLILSILACSTAAQDYSSEIKKMLSNKEDIDIVVNDAFNFTNSENYFLSGDTLYEKLTSFYTLTYAVALKDIDFSKMKIAKDWAVSDATKEPVFGLEIQALNGKNTYSVNAQNSLESTYFFIVLHFERNEMAEQAFAYLKQLAEDVNTKSEGLALLNFDIGKPDGEKKTGNDSKTVTIGSQTWMTENLDVSTFKNGDVIPEVTTGEEWLKAVKARQPAWCYYNNDPANEKKYGKLYNGYAVIDPRGLAPEGWHVPTDIEWLSLSSSLGGENFAGKKMKSTTGWNNNGNGTNESGFACLPAGCRDREGVFSYVGDYGYWWSSTLFVTGTPGWGFYMEYNYDRFLKGLYNYEGLSVRCLKD